jgi:hypothetical protein
MTSWTEAGRLNPPRADKAPHACPTKVLAVASKACTGTMMSPHRMVLNTPQAVA